MLQSLLIYLFVSLKITLHYLLSSRNNTFPHFFSNFLTSLLYLLGMSDLLQRLSQLFALILESIMDHMM
jgi:hypothetical protein